MGVLHIVFEIVVFFAAISLIYYVFQITQAQGDRRANIRYVLIATVVLAIAYPLSNLANQKTVSPTNQISDQVRRKLDKQKKHSSANSQATHGDSEQSSKNHTSSGK